MMSRISSTENQLLQEQPQKQNKPGNADFDLTKVNAGLMAAHDPILGPLGALSFYGGDDREFRETTCLSAKGKAMPKSTRKSATDLVRETFSRSLSGKMSKFGSLESFVFSSAEMATLDSISSVDEWSTSNVTVDHPISEEPTSQEPGAETEMLDHPTPEEQVRKPELRRMYNVRRKNLDFSKVPLPHSAAAFYGSSFHELEVVQACESIDRLNQYLKESRNDLRAGVPGRFLHAVIGQEDSDVGSIASTIMYAFYLHETLSIQLCVLPIINMKREDLSIHAELRWLLNSCHIDPSYLVFQDEIDLSYYDLYGSLKLVLLNGHKLPTKQEAFKEALVEIFNCKQANSLYPWVETITLDEGCSCCTLIAEKFVQCWPEILAGQGFSRLLLAGILLDTANLTSLQCTSKDKYMATLLINGAGRFGCNGLYQILKYKKFDTSDLKVREILRKDFKKWTRVAGKPDSTTSRLTISNIGRSSIGISIEQLLVQEPSAAEEVILFQKSEKLRLLMIVSGYYDSEKNFKREILVSADTAEHMRNLLHFFNSNSSQLPLKVLSQPGLREELRAFEIDNKITSRKTIDRLLEEFGGTARRSQTS